MTAKGYWIFQMNVEDPAQYKRYQEIGAEALRKYGGRFLVRGGMHALVEGSAPPRTVVLEFKDYQTALACWNSPEYTRARSARDGIALGNVVIVEGYEGPQPLGP